MECDYFTDAIDYTQVKMLDEFDRQPLPERRGALHGEVRVNRQIVGFKKVKFYTMENVGAGNLSMPEQEMHTTSFWLHFPRGVSGRFPDLTPDGEAEWAGGSGARAAGGGGAVVDVRSARPGRGDTEDIAGAITGFRPNLYLYDNYPGGIGGQRSPFQDAERLLRSAAELIAGCPCEHGCPSCVGPVGEVGERGKEVAQRVIREILAGKRDAGMVVGV